MAPRVVVLPEGAIDLRDQLMQCLALVGRRTISHGAPGLERETAMQISPVAQEIFLAYTSLMGSRSDSAKAALTMARYFADQAERLRDTNIEAAYYNVDAAIVFGRAVLHRLRAGYCSSPRIPGFVRWENNLYKNSSVLVKFFSEQRNFVLKEGPIGKRRLFSVVLTAQVRATAQISISPTHAFEKFRDQLAHLYERTGRSLKLIAPETPKASSAPSFHNPPPSASQVSLDIYFDDPTYSTEPALGLLRRYFGDLEQIIMSVERRFGT